MSRIAAVLCRASDVAQAGGCDDDLLLAALCMERGIDATFVEALVRIEEGSTDHVCLQGVQGPFILLSRDDGPTVSQHLRRLRVSGELIPTDGAVEPAATLRSMRSIFHILLRPAVDVQRLIARIHAIRRDATARVTQIKLPSGMVLPNVQRLQTQPQATPNGPAYGAATAAEVTVDPREARHGNLAAAERERKLDGLLDELDGFI